MAVDRDVRRAGIEVRRVDARDPERVVPESAPCGSPARFLPTSVNVRPPSRLTCTLPSSVPAQTTPGMNGDSETAMIVLYCEMPSFFENCALSPPTPITVTLQRSICLVRSALCTHDVPRSYDLNSRLPPR